MLHMLGYRRREVFVGKVHTYARDESQGAEGKSRMQKAGRRKLEKAEGSAESSGDAMWKE